STASEAVMHTIVLSNYELSKPATQMSLHKSAKGEGAIRVQFSLVGEKGTDEKTQLKVGEYKTNVGNSGSPFGATTDGRYFYAEEGKENSWGLNGPDIKEGKVLIESVENGVVSGTVDITDGTLTIKGKFTSNIG
ncbi:MAG: hypothetical protein KDD62_04880, partial [Bdellovibrionales bacterium]|nr:hypothetical protein [Bdellovibrionales bacterium]